jgi:hypothetical protein
MGIKRWICMGWVRTGAWSVVGKQAAVRSQRPEKSQRSRLRAIFALTEYARDLALF